MRLHQTVIAVMAAVFMISCGKDVSASIATQGSTSDIIDGTEDSGSFPQVCTITWTNPYDPSVGRFALCTGTLLSPTVLLTAGHCAFVKDWGIGVDPKVACDPVYDPWGSVEHDGHFELFPSMDPDTYDPFAGPDVSVFILKEPIEMKRYASLPPENFAVEVFGDVAPFHGPYFTVVGYGVTDTEWTGTRRVVRNRYYAMTDLYLGAAPSYTRQGDSGAPAFLAASRTIMGIDILSGEYEGTLVDGFARMDLPEVLEFLHQYVP
jgi:hypothetical protein